MDQEAGIEPVEESVEPIEGTEAPETTPEPEIDPLAIEGESGSPPDEAESKEAPEWVRELRKQNRELKRQLKERAAPEPKAVETPDLGVKPTLESCDFDAADYEAKLDAWHTQKLRVDAAAETKRAAKAAEESEWNAKVSAHTDRVKELATRVPKAAEYVADAEVMLSATQRGMIVHASSESHRLLAVLGKNPKLLEETAAIKDPTLFVRRIVEIEMSLAGKKPRTAPERILTGGVAARGVAPGVDATLERLEAEADRTNDRSKVIRYRREIAAAQRAKQ